MGEEIEIGFKDKEEELRYYLRLAEYYARSAHNLLYERDGPKRSAWYRTLVGRAQSILISLYVQEMNRKRRM